MTFTGSSPGVPTRAPRGSSGPGGIRSLAVPLGLGGGLLAAVAVLAVRSPHESGSYGFCPILLLTGYACPGCGGLRSVHELTQLDLVGAASYNVLVVLAVPLAVAGWGLWIARAAGWLRRPARLPAALPWVALVLLVGFGALRNLPALRPVLTPWLGT
ncbi:DUF2752 domain-containing protein [Actinotalea sp. BY-33]|uniref:DUF2752 domain-containing protein n=1 Tax=Actinotalea soli TaxID=2819234 RepID=A0A939LN70_9CELL|nr:DUF2752 domain-containing protein [Actinotalea soli]MBO1750273.1 DUF2752 domain-containing protein [Actinotalea soli]